MILVVCNKSFGSTVITIKTCPVSHNSLKAIDQLKPLTFYLSWVLSPAIVVCKNGKTSISSSLEQSIRKLWILAIIVVVTNCMLQNVSTTYRKEECPLKNLNHCKYSILQHENVPLLRSSGRKIAQSCNAWQIDKTLWHINKQIVFHLNKTICYSSHMTTSWCLDNFESINEPFGISS